MARLIGHFDGVKGTRASGWAANPDAPKQILTVEFFAFGPDRDLTKLGRVRANRPRHDLQGIGIADIHHGFDWRVPFQAGEFLLSARVAGEEIPGGPVRISPKPIHEGALEGVERGVLRGWAWAWDPAIGVEVEIFVDNALRALVRARTERPDLALAGIGDGRHGFEWAVPAGLLDGRGHEVACRIARTSFWLTGSPQTIVLRPSIRSLGIAAGAVRRYARRPALPSATPRELVAYAAAGLHGRGAALGLREVPIAPSAQYLQMTGGGALRRQLDAAADRHRSKTSPAATARRSVRMLIPIWGENYIANFCRIGLPSLLSANNLPRLADAHPLEVVLLTRSRDRQAFAAYPAYQRLCGLAPVAFVDIDDILERYFDPAPRGYATALTYAFFRGMQRAGDAACATDFVFWNGDFLAADGAFGTLAELIAAGVPCTLAPSLRINAAIAPELVRRIGGDAVLEIGPREWVALASRFRDLTVMAQTVNTFEQRMIEAVNQLYWQLDDKLMVGRVFLMFMLHIRPEVMYDDVYGHCDYVFVPEFVPSGRCHFETRSDRLLILELQQQERQSGEIILGDRAITPREVASGVARWTTREHRLASRQLVVFNAAEIAIDLAPVERAADRFMEAVYQRLPEPIWHNGHFHWTDSLAALGIAYRDPGPEHPRSHLAAALRWTGYDIDILRESWPDPAGPPEAVFDLPLPLDPAADLAAWLAAAHTGYLAAWRTFADIQHAERSGIDLVSGRFHGFGWGLLTRGAQGWARRLGPDGRAVLLARVAPSCRSQVWLRMAEHPPLPPDALDIAVNGKMPEHRFVGAIGGRTLVRFDLGSEAAAVDQGRLVILIRASRSTGVAEAADPGFAIVEAVVLPVASVPGGGGPAAGAAG